VPELFAIAATSRDCLVARDPLFSRIEIVIGDAAEFAAADERRIVFMYNPFGEQTLRAVLRHREALSAPFTSCITTPVTTRYLKESIVFDEIGRPRSNKTVHMVDTSI